MPDSTTAAAAHAKVSTGSPRPAVYTVIGWTLFMWATRSQLIFTEADLSFWEVVVRIVPVFLFVALALVLLISVRTGRPNLRRSVVVIGAWTTAYWLVRVTLISIHDHSAGFKIVHAVLAVVSIGTVGWAWRRTSR